MKLCVLKEEVNINSIIPSATDEALVALLGVFGAALKEQSASSD